MTRTFGQKIFVFGNKNYMNMLNPHKESIYGFQVKGFIYKSVVPNMPGQRAIPSARMTKGYYSALAKPWSCNWQ